MEAQNQKQIDRSGPVCKLQTKIPKIQIFGNATSRHANDILQDCQYQRQKLNLKIKNVNWVK